MTDQVTTAGDAGGEQPVAPAIVERTISDADLGDKTGPNAIAAAARALSQARWGKKDEQQAGSDGAYDATGQANNQSASQEDDAAAAEQPPGESATEDNDAALEVPPIERPRSWAKDLDDAWNALPQPLKERLSSFERERDTSTSRRLQEAAEERKALEADRSRMEQARQQYEAKLPVLMQALQNSYAGEFSDIKTIEDVAKMQANDPFRFQQWQVHQMQMQGVKAELDAAEQRKGQDRIEGLKKFESDELVKVAEALPELKDPDKLNKRIGEGLEYLQNLGFTKQDIQRFATDGDKPLLLTAGFQQMVDKAMKYDALQKAKTAVVAKQVPQVQRPGTSRSPNAGATERIQALDSKLTNSGSLKDAVALRVAQMNAGRRRAS